MYKKSKEICESIRQGKDVTKDIAEIEIQLKKHYEFRKKSLQDKKNYSFIYEYHPYEWDALYDVSPSVRNYWNSVYPLFSMIEGRYCAMLRFVSARERFLGIPQIDSVHLLRKCGWTSKDIIAAYLDNRYSVSTLVLSPDAVAEAAREDMDTAVALLNGNGWNDLFTKGYDPYLHYSWIDFMYFFLEYEDYNFLRTNHKRKRLCKYCQEVLEKLERGPAIPENTSEEVILSETKRPDFSIFNGITLHQQHLMASAAGQHLLKGNDTNSYYVLSFHLVDEKHGYGAELCFDAFNKGPDYYDEERMSRGIYFYRFRYLLQFDYVPESWRCSKQELPEDFVNKAFRAFSKLAGLDKKQDKKNWL